MPCTKLPKVIGTIGVSAGLSVGCVMLGIRLSECNRTAQDENGKARNGYLFHRDLLFQRRERSHARTRLVKKETCHAVFRCPHAAFLKITTISWLFRHIGIDQPR